MRNSESSPASSVKIENVDETIEQLRAVASNVIAESNFDGCVEFNQANGNTIIVTVIPEGQVNYIFRIQTLDDVDSFQASLSDIIINA